MTPSPIVVTVDEELEELVPIFLASRAREQGQMLQALERGDVNLLKRLGHQIRGSSGSYGFEVLGELGAKLEQAGEAGDLALCADLVARIGDYVDRIEVVFAAPEGDADE